MKKYIMTIMAMITIALSASGMSFSQAQREALFLTDKMAYELNLTDEQYDAAYEINLDYLMSVSTVDDLYGIYWTRRNLDMGYILLDWQLNAFRAASYFYRPLYWRAGCWHFGIYARYPRRSFYYFGRPTVYITYRGGHSWHCNGGHSFYNGHKDRFQANHDNHFGMRDRFGTSNHGNPGFNNNNRGNSGINHNDRGNSGINHNNHGNSGINHNDRGNSGFTPGGRHSVNQGQNRVKLDTKERPSMRSDRGLSSSDRSSTRITVNKDRGNRDIPSRSFGGSSSRSTRSFSGGGSHSRSAK